MGLKAFGVVGVLLFVGCNSDKQGDDAGAGKSGSGGMVASGGASGAGTAGTGTSASAGQGGSAGRAAGSGGTFAGQGGASAGAAASAGMEADPSVITAQPESIDELELDAERVYWLEGHNRILSVPVAGGTPSVVYASTTPGEYEALHIAIDGERLYFTDQGNRDAQKPRGVFSVPLDGSAERMELLAAPNYGLGSIAVDDGYVYFTATGIIARLPTSGGTATALVRNLTVDSPLVVHEGYVYYWYAPDASGVEQVYRIPVDADAGPLLDDPSAGAGGSAGASSGEAGAAGASGSQPEQISNNTRFSELILAPHVDQGYVYWAIYDELYRVSVDGGAAEMFGMVEFGTSVRMLLADQGSLYWGNGSLNEYVFGGDSNTIVVSSKQGIRDFVANDDSIFVADGKLLRRVDRPKR
jgi:hypothetical protein